MAVEARETGTLIGSDKVEGTAVYGRDNEKIGEIERVMIEKTGGRVSYAVLGFGGFLGRDGEPWDFSSRSFPAWQALWTPASGNNTPRP
jgi:hypothetical protein